MTDASKSEPVFERCQHIFAPHGCGADNQCAREAGHAGSHWCPYSKEGLENLQQCALRNLSSPSIDELDQDESLGSLKRQTLIRQRAIELEASIDALTRQRDGLVELLETCLCPDPHCNNIGTTWHMEQHGPDDVEQVPEPCAWCDLRAKALAAAKETP